MIFLDEYYNIYNKGLITKKAVQDYCVLLKDYEKKEGFAYKIFIIKDSFPNSYSNEKKNEYFQHKILSGYFKFISEESFFKTIEIAEAHIMSIFFTGFENHRISKLLKDDNFKISKQTVELMKSLVHFQNKLSKTSDRLQHIYWCKKNKAYTLFPVDNVKELDEIDCIDAMEYLLNKAYLDGFTNKDHSFLEYINSYFCINGDRIPFDLETGSAYDDY